MRPPVYTHADKLEDAARISLPLFDSRPTPMQKGMNGSARAAGKWTDAEIAALDAAIRGLAASGREFTTDDVWAAAPTVPITKGVASRLRSMQSRGVIRSTEKRRVSRRGGDHDHAQTLTVWIGGAS